MGLIFLIKITFIPVCSKKQSLDPGRGSPHLFADSIQGYIGAAFDDQFIMDVPDDEAMPEGFHEAEVVQDDGTQDALETQDKFSGATELDQKIVQALVDKVVVYDPRHVEIRWKFSDEVLKLLQE